MTEKPEGRRPKSNLFTERNRNENTVEARAFSVAKFLIDNWLLIAMLIFGVLRIVLLPDNSGVSFSDTVSMLWQDLMLPFKGTSPTQEDSN